MKKIIIILATLLMLVGCSNAGYSKLNNGDDVIFKGPNTTFTKQDLYKVLKISSADAIVQDIMIYLAQAYEFDMSDVEKEANDTYDYYKEMGLESYIISSYGTKDAFIKQYSYSGIIRKLTEKYFDDKFDTFSKEDKPVQLQYAYFTDLETANKFIEEVNASTTFETAAANNGYDSVVTPIIFVNDDLDLPAEAKDYINNNEATGLSTVIESSTSSQDKDGNIVTETKYYVLNILDRDINNFKEEYKTRKLENITQEDVIAYMLETHDIKFFDQDLYEIMSKAYEVLK